MVFILNFRRNSSLLLLPFTLSPQVSPLWDILNSAKTSLLLLPLHLDTTSDTIMGYLKIATDATELTAFLRLRAGRDVRLVDKVKGTVLPLTLSTQVSPLWDW